MSDRDIAARYLRSIASVDVLRGSFWLLRQRQEATAIWELLDEACMAHAVEHESADISVLADIRPTMAELTARIEALEKGNDDG